MSSCLDSITNLLPLFLGRINASRIMRAGVKEYDAALWQVLDVFDHAVDIKANGLWVVVPVLLDLQTRVFEDGSVVGPARVWDVDRLGSGEEALEERASYPQGTSTGNGLRDRNVLDGSIVAVCKESGSLGEGRNTSNSSIFLVEATVYDLLLGSLDGGKDVWLALVIAVCANTWYLSILKPNSSRLARRTNPS